MKILHVLYQSLPQVSGSSIRSRDIMLSQKEIGLKVIAVTSNFQPSNSINNKEVIDGIIYVRTSKKNEESISDLKKGILKRISRFFSILIFSKKLYKIIKEENPDIIHAHAMFYCGLPSIFIGKFLKIPVVYEFRSLWMFQKSNTDKSYIERKIESLLFKIETYTLRKSNYSIFLNNNLKEYVFNNGGEVSNYSVVNNAVNTTLINNFSTKIKLEHKELVFGYIGTLTDYEGIEFLVNTFHLLHDIDIKNKLIIYGDGISKESVLECIDKRKDIDNIEFRGSISPNDINKAFNDIDVIINPRKSNDVTEAVTPLKPLEAMAFKKLVIGSDVGGIKEIITNNFNGFLFKAESQKSLMETIQRVIKLDITERNKIINQSINYVNENKSWVKNAKKYKNIYRGLIS